MPDPVQPKTQNLGASLKEMVLSLDRPIQFVTNLTLLGVLGSLIGAFVQYNSWRHEKNLARYREELTSAISTYSEISGALSSVTNLQQTLYFTYKNAQGSFGSIDDDTSLYLKNNAKWTHTEYHTSRTTLRKNVDVLVGKADLFIDRPLRSDTQRESSIKEDSFIASERDVLRDEGFDCTRHMPGPSKHKTELRNITIDWNRAELHVATFYFCLENIHTSLLPVRVWSSDEKQPERRPLAMQRQKMYDIEEAFKRQVKRFNSFIALSTTKIESLRLRDRPSGFLRHQICWDCER